MVTSRERRAGTGKIKVVDKGVQTTVYKMNMLSILVVLYRTGNIANIL